MFTVPTFSSEPPVASIPTGQSGRKGYFDLKPCEPYSTQALMSEDPQGTINAVIFHDLHYYWLRLKEHGEVRPLMHLNDRSRVSLLPRTAANDQLLNKEDTYIYPSTCLVLADFDPQHWDAQGVLGGARPATANDQLAGVRVLTQQRQIHNIPVKKLSTEGPSGEYVGLYNRTLLWDPLHAYHGRPFKLQPNPANIGIVPVFAWTSTLASPVVTSRDSLDILSAAPGMTSRASLEEGAFATDTAMKSTPL